MEIISEQEYTTEVRLIQEQVFLPDVLSLPPSLFTKRIIAKLRICQTEEKFWRGLINSLRTWNPEPIYLYSEREKANLCLKFELDDFEDYITCKKKPSINLSFAFHFSAIFSSKGDWGIIRFLSDVSVVGGSCQMINQLKMEVPNIENDIFLLMAKEAIETLRFSGGLSSQEWKNYDEDIYSWQRDIFGVETTNKILSKAKEIGIYGCSYSYKELKVAYDRIVAERSKEKTDYFNL